MNWREKLYIIIFEADTPAGKAFDVALLFAIGTSVLLVMLESVSEFESEYRPYLKAAEWMFTVLFTIEYILRIISAHKPLKYMGSFFGVIDLIAVIPTYLAFFIAGTHYFVVIRTLRLLRVFRILKLAKYVGASRIISEALVNSKAKISVFLFAVLNSVIILGTLMYLIEGSESGFTSIPRSIYWAVVTLTTVGYGDIAPSTVIGQFLASIIMILGYAIIAVPTGIVTSELTRSRNFTNVCDNCGTKNDANNNYCSNCGNKLENINKS
ncbi:ion transporter [Hyphobacterium sp. CCMP332]|nr:ion transporter [Hyphobacterium sp. CCMP332]